MSIIFISHSRRDTSLVQSIRQILTNVGHTATIEELIPENEKKPIPHDEIAEKVSECDVVFLFLTDNVLATEYTKSWVIFEVGLARQSKKRVFVFEKEGISIPYPLPYFTDYMIFDPQSIDDLLGVQKIAKSLVGRVPVGWMGAGAGALAGAIFGPIGLAIGALAGGLLGNRVDIQVEAQIPNVECPQCHIRFRYFSPGISDFKCPACRESITFDLWSN